MTARQRSGGLALLLVGGVLTAALVSNPRLQGAFPVPARITQGGAASSPEPPLVPAPPGVIVPGPAAGAPCPVDPPTPVVAIRVRVPACAVAGQELEYRICVENCSKAPAHHVFVRNPLPENARYIRSRPEPNVLEPELVWALGTLEPCECREICLVLCPTGPCDLQNCARVRFEHGQCVCTKIEECPPPPPPVPPTPPQPPPTGAGLVLRKSGPAHAVLFEPFTYQLSLANTGAEPATNVVVTDTLPAALEPVGRTVPLTWDVGTLEPGKEWKVEYQVIARQPGKWCNQAVSTARGGQKQEASSCVIVGRPKLELNMIAPAQRALSNPIRYQITVGNPSPIAATNVTVTNPVPDSATFESASDGGQVTDNRVVWSLGTLPAGTRKTVTLTLRGKMIGELVNRATATADRHEMAESRATTLLDEGTTGLTFDIDDLTDPVEVGSQTTYLITVRNQGTTVAKKVAIKATVPPQFQVVKVKGPAKDRQEGQVVTFEPIDLEMGKTASYEITVKALQAGEVRFSAELSSDVFSSGQPVRKEESTTIFNP